MDVTVVTPWHDHPELIPDYVEALAGELEDGDAVVVVDNGSNPPLDVGIGRVRVLRLAWNAGFAKASNAGLAIAETDAVLFLNNDIRKVYDGWLRRLRDALEPGVLVGRLRYDRHGDVDGHALPYLDGWCLLATRDDLLELGGFDEDYAEPAYFSDNDLSLRARAAGMTLRAAGIGLFHKTGATAGDADDPAKLAAISLNAPRFAARARELLSGAVA